METSPPMSTNDENLVMISPVWGGTQTVHAFEKGV